MSKFLNNTTRTIAWFKKANDSSELQMKPPFQRNPVWNHPQKSYLIDSVLNGFPIPEIYMQEFVDENGKEQHIIIDGQQRIRSCLEFIEGKYSIREEESSTWANMYFDDLSTEHKKSLFGYTFVVRILPDMPDEDIRGIFQRLNKNVVALNSQELRQATYWGPFIKAMQEISDYPYWSTSGIFTPLNIRRMIDVEYISELAVAVLHGHQNKKESLDKYYLEYEEDFEYKEELIKVFQKAIFEIEQTLPDIKITRWRKKTDFYSLFIYLASKERQLPLSSDCRFSLRAKLIDFGENVSKYLSTESEGDQNYSQNVLDYGKSIRASSDLGNRKRRHFALDKELCQIFQQSSAPVANITIPALRDGLFALDENLTEP